MGKPSKTKANAKKPFPILNLKPIADRRAKMLERAKKMETPIYLSQMTRLIKDRIPIVLGELGGRPVTRVSKRAIDCFRHLVTTFIDEVLVAGNKLHRDEGHVTYKARHAKEAMKLLLPRYTVV